MNCNESIQSPTNTKDGESHQIWRVGHGRSLSLDCARLMGIVNVTPDSFSDGGKYIETEDAIAHGLRCVEEGAAVLDIGGESTRPGAARVDENEQIKRIIPVIAGLKDQMDTANRSVLLSVDTTLAAVASAAIDAGAHIVNDVSAGREDRDMLQLIAAKGAGVVLMHRMVAPGEDVYSDQYTKPPEYGNDCVAEVCKSLQSYADTAISAGVSKNRIVLDPGLGFGKSVEQNYELLRKAGTILSLGYPVLCAVSRKSFIGTVTGQGVPCNRDAGSIAIAVLQFASGVRLFRVHDVASHKAAFDVSEAISSAEGLRDQK